MRSRAGAKGAGLFLCRERVCREMDVCRESMYRESVRSQSVYRELDACRG